MQRPVTQREPLCPAMIGLQPRPAFGRDLAIQEQRVDEFLLAIRTEWVCDSGAYL